MLYEVITLPFDRFPPAISGILRKSLSQGKGDRYPDAGVFAQAIAGAIPETVSRTDLFDFWDLLFPGAGQKEDRITSYNVCYTKLLRVFQHTVSKALSFAGTGLHTGVGIRARILPADPDTGIVFLRKDTNTEIPARVENVVETAYATVLSASGVKVSTVEHFLAALYGMEIDNSYNFV